MADSMPNYKVELQKLVSQRATLNATKERQTLEIMELEDRVARNLINIENTDKALSELDNRIRDLVEAHKQEG